jgi:hypothetical protein
LSRQPTNVRWLLASLEDAGCQPRAAGPGVWFALCPTCRLAGHLSLVEIREPGIVCCVNAHEAPKEAA